MAAGLERCGRLSIMPCTRRTRIPSGTPRLLADVPTDPPALAAVARNVIVHYRASGHELPMATRDEINARWLEDILAADQGRHPWPLTEPREVTDRVQGCCRDHSLFCVGVLRSHGIAARSRVGFAGYFIDGWHHDHVIVETWLDDRWVRFDSEVDAPRPSLPTPMDIGPCRLDGTGFVTAAEAWVGLPPRGDRRRHVRRRSGGARLPGPLLPVRRGDLSRSPIASVTSCCCGTAGAASANPIDLSRRPTRHGWIRSLSC